MKTSIIWTETEVHLFKNPYNLQTTYNLDSLNTGLVDKVEVWYDE